MKRLGLDELLVVLVLAITKLVPLKQNQDADGKFVVNAGSNITFDDADGHLVINSSGGTIENADTQASGRTYIAEITSKTEGNITTSTYKSHAFFSNFKSTSDYSTASIDSSDVVFLTVKA